MMKNKNIKTFSDKEVYIIEADYEGETYTFVQANDDTFLLLAPINDQQKCHCCPSLIVNSYFIARKGETFKIRRCNGCKSITLEEFEYEKAKIPLKVLGLIDLEWKLVEKEKKIESKS